MVLEIYVNYICLGIIDTSILGIRDRKFYAERESCQVIWKSPRI